MLLNDAQNAAVDGVGNKLDAGDVESDDGDDEWADEGGEFASGDKDLDFLSDLLGRDGSLSKYLDGDSEDGEAEAYDEQDLKDDPIYALDIQVSSCPA